MKKIAAFILFVLQITSLYASTLPSSPPEIPKKIQNFISILKSETVDLQGGAIAILHKGQVIYKVTFGHAQGQTGTITSKTLFPLASVSKSVAATALALRVDSEEVDLTQLHALPFLKSKVHLKHILSHSTGVSFSGNPQIEQGKSRTDLLNKLKMHPSACQPGKCYSYSNTTFSLIEEILNKRNLTFKEVIDSLAHTLKTRGIQTLPLPSGAEIAYPHKVPSPNPKTLEKDSIISLPFPPYYPKVVPASAGVFASLDGMIEVLKLQSGYRPDLISPNTLNQFYEPMIPHGDLKKWSLNLPFSLGETDSFYALGFRILRSKKIPHRDFIYHGGSISGISTFFGFIPSEEVGIIILLNQNSRFALQKGLEFWYIFLESVNSQ